MAIVRQAPAASVGRITLTPHRARTRINTVGKAAARPTAAGLGLAAVEAFIGYDWLLSALNKILSPTFRSGLAAQLTMSMSGNPNTWWAALARQVALPHAQLCAVLVEIGELLVALGFFLGAALWAGGRFPTRRWAHVVNGGVLLALAGGAAMTANYYLMSGATLPWIDPHNAFNEGLSLDGLLTFITGGLFAVHLASIWPHKVGADDRAA